MGGTDADDTIGVIGVGKYALGEELGAPFSEHATLNVDPGHICGDFEEMYVDPGR